MIKKIILSLLLSCSIASLHSMQELTFSDLPQDIIGSLFLELAEKESFKISLKNMAPFAATNKDIYKLFSTDKKLITDIINNLKNPLLQIEAYKKIALELNTQAALATLKGCIDTNNPSYIIHLLRSMLMMTMPYATIPYNIILAKKLLSVGVRATDDGLVSAIRHNKLDYFTLFLAYKTDINEPLTLRYEDRINESKKTLLIQAASYNQLEMVAILIQNKADVNVQDSGGDTALICAARNSAKLEIIKMLLKAGANPLTKNLEHKTALKSTPQKRELNYKKIESDKIRKLLERVEKVYKITKKQ
jgi:Ankyrin repeats (many copies)